MTCALGFLSPQERARELKAGHQYHKEQLGGALSAIGENIKGLVGGGNKHKAGDDASEVGGRGAASCTPLLGGVKCSVARKSNALSDELPHRQDVWLGVG